MENNNHGDKKRSLVCTCCGHYGDGEGCQCGWHSSYHGHRLLRIVILLVILAFVFLAGVKAGELKERFSQFFYRGDYGNMIRHHGGGSMMGGYPLPEPALPPAIPPVPAPSK